MPGRSEIRKRVCLYMVIGMTCLMTCTSTINCVGYVKAQETKRRSEYEDSGKIKQYELEISRKPGSFGYYTEKPEVSIRTKDDTAVTKYEFTDAEGKTVGGELKRAGDKKLIASNCMKEGENSLKVWMEAPHEVISDPDPEPDPEPDPDPEPEPDPKPEPDPEPESKPDPVPDPKPDSESAPDPVPNPEPEPKPDPAPNPKLEPKPNPNPAPDPEPDPKPDPEPKPDPDPEPKPDPEPDPEPEPKPDPDPAPVIVWEVVEKSVQQHIFRIDTKAPGKVSLSYERDPSEGILFYNTPARLVIRKSGNEEDLKGICYKIGEEPEQLAENEEVELLLPLGFYGTVQASALDKAGNRSEPVTSVVFLCESVQPAISMTAPRGFETWYDQETQIQVRVEDTGLSAGLENVKCFVNGVQVTQNHPPVWENENVATVAIPVQEVSEKGSVIPVIVEAADRAGNVNSHTELLHIDKQKPEIEVKDQDGKQVEDCMITSRSLDVICEIREENVLKGASVQGSLTDVEETSRELPEAIWDSKEGKQTAHLKLEENGVYQITVSAEDAAGHSVAKNRQILIDKENPVIRYVEQLDGNFLRYFQWNYELREMIQDHTSYTYEMQLDGKAYRTGEKITGEGRHTLQVRATDAAGNEAEKHAEFTIDHTAPSVVFGNVKDGAVYEDNVTLAVSLKNASDKITEITIDGEKQQIDKSSQVFRFPFQEKGNYSVAVKAEDIAGNRTEQSVHFRIREQSVLSAKVVQPIRRVFTRRPSKTEKENEKKAEKSSFSILARVIIYGVIGVAILGGVLGGGFLLLHRRSRKAD